MSARFCSVLVLLGLLAGCTGSSAAPPASAPSGPAERKPEGKPMPDSAALVKGNTEFALDLYARLRAEESGNLFFSPGSISTALAMTWAGARGETEREMAEALNFRLRQEKLHPAFASLLGPIQEEQQEDGYQLHIANRLWGQQGYDFLPEFLEITRENYGAELAEVDFVRQTEQARQTINAWVERQTAGRIEDLIPPGVLDSMSRLVLTNAIYFKGDWANPFDKKATKEAPFRVTEREKVAVPMMFQKEYFNYRAADGMQVLELPYAGDDLSMFVLLPEKVGGLAGLEQKLTPENLERWTSGLRAQEVEVSLPRFTMTSEFQLGETLQSLGMTRAFGPGQADFSGMNGRKDLFVSAVVHKAFVDVNEEGTEAAAATGVVVGVTALREPTVFRADHPFVFLIRDNRTNSLLFLGRVVNPKG